MLGSFKFKLVGTFLALSVLPLAAAFWGFSQVAERSVTTGADDRLAAGLTAAVAAFEDERRDAERAAERLGANPAFQTALASRRPRRDQGARFRIRPLCVSRLPAERSGASRLSPPRRRSRSSGPATAPRRSSLSVPLTGVLVRRLHARSGLAAPDELAIVELDGRITASSSGAVGGAIDVVAGSGRDGERSAATAYRALGARLVPDAGSCSRR